MSYKVYHNPRCSKSRIAVNYLEEKGAEIEVIEYLKELPSREEFKNVITQLGISPEMLVRKGEAIYKEQFKGKTLSEDEWIDAMLEYPKLIERPIVILNNKAVVARPVEKIEEL